MRRLTLILLITVAAIVAILLLAERPRFITYETRVIAPDKGEDRVTLMVTDDKGNLVLEDDYKSTRP